jgi:hypothetical protein
MRDPSPSEVENSRKTKGEEVAMRTSKAFLSAALVASVGLFAATGVMATGSGGSTPTPTPTPPPLPTWCSTGWFQVSVSNGPSFVGCTANASNPSGVCTEIEYTVSSNSSYPIPDHVAALEGYGIQYVTGPGNQWYPPCAGDPVTDLGERSCHEQAAKFNPSNDVKTFKIGLAGQRKPSPTTVATKKGTKIGACRIEGIGLENVAGVFQSTPKVECNNFKGCVVCFTRDPATGDVLNAELEPPAPDGQSTLPACGGSVVENCCSAPITSTIDKLNLSLDIGDGVPLGAGQIGDGYISSGTNSCTTRVIGGKVYTWGTPCPNP